MTQGTAPATSKTTRSLVEGTRSFVQLAGSLHSPSEGWTGFAAGFQTVEADCGFALIASMGATSKQTATVVLMHREQLII